MSDVWIVGFVLLCLEFGIVGCLDLRIAGCLDVGKVCV